LAAPGDASVKSMAPMAMADRLREPEATAFGDKRCNFLARAKKGIGSTQGEARRGKKRRRWRRSAIDCGSINTTSS